MLCHEVPLALQDELDAHHNGEVVKSRLVSKVVLYTGFKQNAVTRAQVALTVT
jgi:hypothetical protein